MQQVTLMTNSFIHSSIGSAIQAIIVTILSIRTMVICTDLLHDQDPVLESYIVGLNSYFTYDLTVMYVEFVSANNLQMIAFKDRVIRFSKAETSIILHHLLNQLVFGPMVLVGVTMFSR